MLVLGVVRSKAAVRKTPTRGRGRRLAGGTRDLGREERVVDGRLVVVGERVLAGRERAVGERASARAKGETGEIS